MASFYSGNPVGAVVADIGSYAAKIGWAGDDFPRSYFRSTVAVLSSEQGDARNSSNNHTHNSKDPGGTNNTTRSTSIQDIQYDYYTHCIQRSTDSDGNYQPVNPIHYSTGLLYDDSHSDGVGIGDGNHEGSYHGTTTELLPELIRHGYRSALKNSTPDQHPLLLAERSYNPPAIRQRLTECLFEELQCPAAFLAKDAVLMTYGVGRTTATVVDMGYNQTVVTPVFDGYVEGKGLKRCPVGLRAMDTFILEQLDVQYRKQQQPTGYAGAALSSSSSTSSLSVMPLYQVQHPQRKQRGLAFHTLARLQLAQECREIGVGASINLVSPMPGEANASTMGPGTATGSGTATGTGGGTNFLAPTKTFTLPDGTVVHVPSANRFDAAEFLLGNPHFDGSHDSSINNTNPLQERRNRLLDQCKKDLTNVIARATEEDPDEELFSQAAAVGISKRRGTKRSAAGATSLDAKSGIQRPFFVPGALRKAVVPQLQIHLDQQLTAQSVAAMVCDAAYLCDRDQQTALLGNVVLGGGGACLGPTDQAVPEFLREQIEFVIHAHTPGWRVKMLSPARPERAILAWLGGSILGSLGSFHEMWITKSEYEEWGSAIVNRKCP